MHQYDWQYNSQTNPIHNPASVSHHDFPYNKELLTRPSHSSMKKNLPPAPRRLPSIPGYIHSNNNYSNNNKMQESPTPMMNQGLPFANMGVGRKGEISVGGTGLGLGRNVDPNFDRIDPHTTQNSPQKRNYSKSRNSWLSEGAEKEMNPEPLPFMPSEFKSSTVIKKMPIHQRHGDMWGGDFGSPKPKGYAFHTERYGFEDINKSRSPDMLAAGPAMDPNIDFINRMRFQKRTRQRESREPLNLVMGGQQVALFERDDIQDELRKLKGIVLPKKAKDLYVGRGFKIPEFHAVNKPRPARFKVSNTPDDLRKPGTKPDYYAARDPASVKLDGGWSKTELQSEDAESEADDKPAEDQVIVPKKTPTPEPSSNAVIIPREPTFDMGIGTDQPPRSATTKTATTPNPLKGGPIENFVESSEFDKLKKTFKRLDTDMDGHLQFLQLKGQLPKGITHSQERFIKIVYDITSSSTFFGLNEYISMNIMCQRIASLQGPAKEAFQKLNFGTLESTLKFYTDLFQSVDRHNTGKITQESLRQILNTALEEKMSDQQFADAIQMMQVGAEINKMDFLAYIPYFLSLEHLYIHS